MRSEDNWHGVGRFSSYFGLGRRRRKNEVDLGTDKFGSELCELLDRFRRAKLDDEVFPLNVSEVAQPAA